MAKRKKASPWVGESRDNALDGMFGSMRDAAQQALGGDVSVGSEIDENHVGLPLPALCLRYLFQSTTYPLSRIMQITGEEGSAKSAFLYEIFRWHMVYGGGAILAENENKDSPVLRHSILQWQPQFLSRMVVKPTDSLEAWQSVFTTFVQTAKKMMDAKDGPGRTVPMCIACDSLMATAPQAEIDSVNKAGHATRGYALAANLIARYMRTMPSMLKEYPFTVVGTNHLKPSTDIRGLPVNNIPGGKAVKFMETFEIEMKKAYGKHDIDKLDYGGLRLKFTARKNSIGPSRKSITAELLWWYVDDGNGGFRQETAWDWDTATIELLASFENVSGKKTVFNQLREVTGINVVSKSQRTAYSDILGIPKSDPQLYRAVAGALEARPDVLAEVYKILGISCRAPFKPGVDYRDLLKTAKEEAQVQGQDLYAGVEDMPTVGDALTQDGDMAPEELGGVTSEQRAEANGVVE